MRISVFTATLALALLGTCNLIAQNDSKPKLGESLADFARRVRTEKAKQADNSKEVEPKAKKLDPWPAGVGIAGDSQTQSWYDQARKLYPERSPGEAEALQKKVLGYALSDVVPFRAQINKVFHGTVSVAYAYEVLRESREVQKIWVKIDNQSPAGHYVSFRLRCGEWNNAWERWYVKPWQTVEGPAVLDNGGHLVFDALVYTPRPSCKQSVGFEFYQRDID